MLWKQSLLCETIPFLRYMKKHIPDGSKDGPCLMLIEDEDKKVCLIHKLFGYDAKPDICKDYPAQGKLCQREINGKRI